MAEGAVATQQPVRRAPKDLGDSRRHTPAQPVLLNDELTNRTEKITPLDRPLMKGEAEALAFNEDPIRILIHRDNEDENASPTTDFIANNGIKAEILVGDAPGRWVQVGYLPKGIPFYTKRKYVEQLARAKVDKVKTRVKNLEDGDRQNLIDRSTRALNAFQVLEDRNPLGGEWLQRVLLARW